MVGAVTLEGDPAGVYLTGERRDIPVFAPGGYSWTPALGQEVLVLKTGPDGESPCVAGVPCSGKTEPGEVLICSADGTASIRLGKDGMVAIEGRNVTVNGKPLESGGQEQVGGG